MSNKPPQFSLARLFVLVAGAAGMVAQLIACICEPHYISAAYDVPILLTSILVATWLTRLPEHPQHRYSSGIRQRGQRSR